MSEEGAAPAWWIRRNPLDDLADAAQQLAFQWRHYRDWERLMADDPEAAQQERNAGLLQWHRGRLAQAITRLDQAVARAGTESVGLSRGVPFQRVLTAVQMAERYTPWPPMQTREERATNDAQRVAQGPTPQDEEAGE